MSEQEARDALLEFIDSQYTSLMQAIDHMAESNDKTATLGDQTNSAYLSRIGREAAASWRNMAEQLTERWSAAFPDVEG
jgi:hypothetical protein